MMINTLKNNHFSLVLSGGGALGISHLGILFDIEKYNLSPNEIIGTSMGGIVAACMAIGMKEKEIHKQINNFSSVSKWIRFSLSGNAIVENSKIEDIFEDIFGNRKMKDTHIPLKLIATDLLNGDKRVFTQDDDVYIKDAILASMAIPGIFDEHEIDGKVYGDGFLCENLGVNEAVYDIVLAADVLGEHSFEKEMPDNFLKTANVLEMFEKSMRILIYNQTRINITNCKKKVYLLQPETMAHKTYHFHKVNEIRALGLNLLKDNDG